MKQENKGVITPDAATTIATHLVFVINNPNTPGNLAQAICEALGDEFNRIGNENQLRITEGNHEYVKNVLLAAGGNPEAIQHKEIERQDAERSMVRELYNVIEDDNTPKEVKRYLLDYMYEKTGMCVEITDSPVVEDMTLPELLTAAAMHEDTPDELARELFNLMEEAGLDENEEDASQPSSLLSLTSSR